MKKSTKTNRKALFVLILFTLILLPLLSANAQTKATVTPQNATDFLAGFVVAQTFPGAQARAPAPARFVTVFDNKVMEGWDSLKGKVVVANLWAIWCAPCIEELPTLHALHEQRASDKLEIMTLSTDYSPKPDKIAKALEKAGFSGDQLHIRLDPADRAGFQAYIGVALPTTFVIAPDGQLLYKLKGPADWASPGALAFIDQILANYGAAQNPEQK